MHASAILQAYLDEVGRTVMTDDWNGYNQCVDLPCHIITDNENKIVATTEDLRAGFDMFCSNLHAQRVTDYIRLVDSAQQQDPGLIRGRYITHMIAGSQRLMPPFMSEITLRLVGNRWRAVLVNTALANSRWPLIRLEINPDTPIEGSQE